MGQIPRSTERILVVNCVVVISAVVVVSNVGYLSEVQCYVVNADVCS